MRQMDIELILMRQLASCLAMPVFLVDPTGNLVYYNEPAEKILGRRFEESGPMQIQELATIFQTFDETGISIASQDLPLSLALSQHKPAHKRIWIRGLDGRKRQIEVTAIPIIGQQKQVAGAAAIFWEIKEPKK
ncbi:MAG: PAS domain-containing protein [Verrucomicrobia bacterium]|nr:PAS domain-containing protein [Verrucomicrobiota bacterium]